MEKNRYIQIRVTDEWLKAVDALRKNEDDLPSKSEMVRRAIMRALQETRRSR